ncbi:hypothetical protein [Streptomyces sp. 8N706]|uniref:hypothetical protein n=1 Tax=Streptomyces sp. 8N706 TaxID=3457416 RepID=UPI003FCF0D34
MQAHDTASSSGLPELGTLVKDTSREDGVGVVMSHLGPYVQLRPVGGGREWDAKPDAVRPLTPREELSVRLAERNEGSRRGKMIRSFSR